MVIFVLLALVMISLFKFMFMFMFMFTNFLRLVNNFALLLSSVSLLLACCFILSLFIILHFRTDHKQNGSRLLIKRMRKFLRGLNQLEIRLHHLETVSLAEKRPDGFCDLCEKGLLVAVEIDEQQ